MALLAVQTITLAGTVVTRAAAGATGDLMPNDGRSFLVVANGHAVDARTVTLTTPAKVGGLNVEDVSVSVLALTERWIGPCDPVLFNNAAAQIAVSYNTEADVTVAVVRLPRP